MINTNKVNEKIAKCLSFHFTPNRRLEIVYFEDKAVIKIWHQRNVEKVVVTFALAVHVYAADLFKSVQHCYLAPKKFHA